MFHENTLSTESVPAPFSYPRNIPKSANLDFEYGGVAIQDGSQGLRVRVWRGEYLGGSILISADGIAPITFATEADIIDIGISFDQNMNPFACWELEDGTARFRWFDSTVPGFVTTTLPSGSYDVRCAHDDTRDIQVTGGVSDVILSYLRAGSLYFRLQRERYLTERLLSSAIGERRLIQTGLNEQLRFQWRLSAIAEQSSP